MTLFQTQFKIYIISGYLLEILTKNGLEITVHFDFLIELENILKENAFIVYHRLWSIVLY